MVFIYYFILKILKSKNIEKRRNKKKVKHVEQQPLYICFKNGIKSLN